MTSAAPEELCTTLIPSGPPAVVKSLVARTDVTDTVLPAGVSPDTSQDEKLSSVPDAGKIDKYLRKIEVTLTLIY